MSTERPPETPVYGLRRENPDAEPGLSLRGDQHGSGVLANQIEEQLTRLTARSAEGYEIGEKIVITAAATFEKGNFPGLRAVWAVAVGGGGGGGNAPSATSSVGSGGAAGATAMRLIDAADMDASEPVAVGAGGAGTGQAGTDTILGDPGNPLIRATGGGGGLTVSAAGVPTFSTRSAIGGAPSVTTSVGDLIIPGGGGGAATLIGPPPGLLMLPGQGGASTISGRPPGRTGAGIVTGDDGITFGGGGNGAASPASAPAENGGVGAVGALIITTLF